MLLSNKLLAVNFLPAEVLLEIALEAESYHKCQYFQSRASLKTHLPSFCSAFFLSYGQFCNSSPLPFHLFVCAEMYTACMYTRIQHIHIYSAVPGRCHSGLLLCFPSVPSRCALGFRALFEAYCLGQGAVTWRGWSKIRV